MKKLIIATLMIVVCSLTVMAQNIQPIANGSSIPMADVNMTSVNGNAVAIKDVMGKNGVLVMFSCNTCPYVVRYESRILNTIALAKAQGLGVIIINANEALRTEDDSFEAMKVYATKQGFTVPYVVDTDSKVANAFGATRTPECFLFNNESKLVYHGAIDDNANDANAVTRIHVKEAITELISGKAISVKESRSVGCTIKRKEN
jgi:peroxiredoxin